MYVEAENCIKRYPPPISLSACLSVCLPACLSVCLFVYMCVCLPACLSVCLHVCLSACLSVYLSACLPVSAQESGVGGGVEGVGRVEWGSGGWGWASLKRYIRRRILGGGA